ncbi:MAG: hypothetical protein NT162_03745 [Candidatus Woesebacteria bacterium]|nr:hypothetical protein [Candidatus Woesebacteria bacterium]
MESLNPVTPVVSNLPKSGIKKVWPYIVGAFLVVLVGIGTAWMISGRTASGKSSAVVPGAKVSSTEAGALDPKVKYDTATGILATGGLNNEGTFHLVREGGPSKYVYLTSSVVDLNNFVDKKVELWGQTLASKKVGWLMDVAKIKIAP